MQPRASLSLSLSTFVVLAGTLAACSSGPTDNSATAGDNALVVNPGGNEHESTLTVRLPNDACVPGASCAKVLSTAPSIFVDGVPVALGASTLLNPGTHNLAVNGLGSQVTTSNGQNLVLALPVVQAQCTNAVPPSVPSTAFGKTLALTNAPCPATLQGSAAGVPGPQASDGQIYYDAGCSSNDTLGQRISGPTIAAICASSNASYPNVSYNYRNSANRCIGVGTGLAGCQAAEELVSIPAGSTYLADQTWRAYPPGSLSATVDGATQTLAINAGDEVAFPISLPVKGSVPATFATTIKFLSPRANPDAAAATIVSSCAGDRNYAIPASTVTTTTPAPLALAAFVAPGCNYTLTVGGRAVVLAQTAANDITVDRLDINDVTLTRDNGTTFTVKGSWTLNFGGVQVAGPFLTGTGIDLMPGTYQLSVSYTDLNGPHTQTQTITI